MGVLGSVVSALAVLAKTPLPPDNGGRQRLVHLLRGLRRLGPLDLVIAEPISDEQRQTLAELTGGRVHAAGERLPRRRFPRLASLRSPNLPLGLSYVDPTAHRRDGVSFVADAHYDVTWFSTARSLWLHGDLYPAAPCALDLPDITSVQMERALGARRRSSVDARGALPLRVDRGRWRRFEPRISRTAGLVTVTSSTDARVLADLGGPPAVVVPNGHDRVAQPLGRVEVGPSPRLVFPGQLSYAPNADAAAWFAADVLPLVRKQMPAATFEIVGRSTPAVDQLGALPGVEVTGYLDDIDDALRRADALVVPIRLGSGTRVKILEAFAHLIPVVSTSIGAEGLGVVDGRDVLLADDAQAFAAASVRVVTDMALRARLRENGAECHRNRFDWAMIEERFAEEIEALCASNERRR